jgi:phospholipid/cholesterol/gamma-HCH transport system substrate-binding protein
MEPQKKVTWKDLRVGLLVLSGSVLLVLAILLMGGGGGIDVFSETVEYRTFLPEANGLKSGSEVWLAGVEVGEVKSVRFSDPSDIEARDAIEVTLEVDAIIAARIRKDSSASLRTIGLLGDKYVEITPGSPDQAVVQPDGIIRGISLSTFDEFVGVGRTTARGFNELMEELRTLAVDINNREGTLGKIIHTPDVYNNVNATLQQTNQLLTTAEKGPGTLGRLMSDPTLYNNLMASSIATRQSIARLDSTIQAARALVRYYQNPEGTVGRLTNDPAMYYQMQRSLTRIDSLTQSIESLVKNIEQGEGSIGRLIQRENLALEMESLVIDLRGLVRDIQANPKKYFKVSVF